MPLFLTLFTVHTAESLPTNLCFPFADPTHSVAVFQVSTWSLVVTLPGTFFAFLSLHIALICALKKSQKNIQKSDASDKTTAIVIQVIVLTLSKLLCWVPFLVFCVTFMYLKVYPFDLIIWLVVVIVPVNSLVHPVVFLVLAVRKYRDERRQQKQKQPPNIQHPEANK